jgi:hypothetical protein
LAATGVVADPLKSSHVDIVVLFLKERDLAPSVRRLVATTVTSVRPDHHRGQRRDYG